VLKGRGLSTAVGDEGGFAPDLKSNEEALETILEAINKAGYRVGEDIALGLDVASSEFYESGKYNLVGEGKRLSSEQFVEFMADWCRRYPIVEQASQPESDQDALGGASRFVGEHGDASMTTCHVNRFDDTLIGPRVVQQAIVVDLQKSRERTGLIANAHRTQGTADQHPGPFPDHPADGVLGQFVAAKLHDQLIGRLGEVAPGINQCPVEVERNQPAYVAHDVGVSHTVTFETGRPCSRETSNISRAMRSAVGLLSSRYTGSPIARRAFARGSSCRRIIL
jgi:hypothetical protein